MFTMLTIFGLIIMSEVLSQNIIYAEATDGGTATLYFRVIPPG
jgi:hypothetical protein